MNYFVEFLLYIFIFILNLILSFVVYFSYLFLNLCKGFRFQMPQRFLSNVKIYERECPFDIIDLEEITGTVKQVKYVLLFFK